MNAAHEEIDKVRRLLKELADCESKYERQIKKISMLTGLSKERIIQLGDLRREENNG